MKYFVWLQSVLGCGYGKTAAIIDRFGSPKGVYSATYDELYNSGLFTPKALKCAKDKSLLSAEKTLNYCKQNEIDIICYGSGRYPECLARIPDFPLVLYLKGKMPDFNREPSVCIVGPRKCSDFGIKASYSLSARLSLGGMVIVSGGAVGVDCAAHKGALAANGATVLLMPCGFGYDYLKENENLREDIINQNGCVITEFPPETPVGKAAFQVRNRLMSALTLGTVLIEAGERSGALITARHALEQGRDVFVIPGNPTLPQYFGSNNLLRDGAKPVLTANDVFLEYISIYKDKLDIEKAFSTPLKPMEQSTTKRLKEIEIALPPESAGVDISMLSAIALSIYNAAPAEPFCVDELSVFCDYNASELMAAMTELEIMGAVKAIPGGRYLKVQ